MKKTKLAISLLFLILAIPLINAQEESCGLTNLATCIPEKFFNFLLSIVNAPLQPFLTLTKSLLSEPVNLDSFLPLWAIVVYVLSFFYGIFIILAGFNFIISGYSPEKRERAKAWLRNVILMMVLVQASFFLYSILNEIASSMTAGILNLIDSDFFKLTSDSVESLGLDILLAIPYALTLLLTILFLTVRYILVAAGVVFFPIGLFLYFIPPLEGYGKLVLNVTITLIFLPFAFGLVILVGAKLVEIPLFGKWKTVVMISTFLLINTLMVFLVVFAIIKAAFGAARTDVGRAVIMSYSQSSRQPLAPQEQMSENL